VAVFNYILFIYLFIDLAAFTMFPHLPAPIWLAYQGLEEENLDQKSPGPPGWALMLQANPLLIGKEIF